MIRVEVRNHRAPTPAEALVGHLCADGGRVWAEPSDDSDTAWHLRKFLTCYGPDGRGVEAEADLRWLAEIGYLPPYELRLIDQSPGGAGQAGGG